eukprot:5094550-Pyramimonas_sp.AAC.1
MATNIGRSKRHARFMFTNVATIFQGRCEICAQGWHTYTQPVGEGFSTVRKGFFEGFALMCRGKRLRVFGGFMSSLA